MNIQNMKIADIRPYEKNPRLNEGAVDAVAASKILVFEDRLEIEPNVDGIKTLLIDAGVKVKK